MLVFDACDPFPLVGVGAGSGSEPAGVAGAEPTGGAVTYAEAQVHAAAVDKWLGFELDAIEARLAREHTNFSGARDEQHWIGLPIQTLQTPYTEIRELLSLLDLKPGDHIVDLGAGYGRMGFVVAAHHPGVGFTGYEVVSDRVAEGRRVLGAYCERVRAASAGSGRIENQRFAPTVGDPHGKLAAENLPGSLAAGGQRGSLAARDLPPAEIELQCADLSDPGFLPRAADFYFLYDFGSRTAISKTLNDLKQIAATKPITVIGRGRSSRDAIERTEPWLSQVNPPRHFSHYSIYRS